MNILSDLISKRFTIYWVRQLYFYNHNEDEIKLSPLRGTKKKKAQAVERNIQNIKKKRIDYYTSL